MLPAPETQEQGLCQITIIRNQVGAGRGSELLELVGGALAIKTFAKDRSNIHVHLQMDNTSTIAYLNHMGGTRSQIISHSACSLWRWCLQRQPSIQHHGRLGIADTEVISTVDAGERCLSQSNGIFGPLLSRSFRIKAKQSTHKICQLAPRPLRNRILVLMAGGNRVCLCTSGQVHQEACKIVLIAPTWDTQPWYPTLLDLLVYFPILLPGHSHLLTDLFGRVHPLVINKRLQLAAWRVSGSRTLQEGFWSRLQTLSWQDGARCSTRKINPFSSDVKDFLDFLADLLHQGLQHRSINTIRSAVSCRGYPYRTASFGFQTA